MAEEKNARTARIIVNNTKSSFTLNIGKASVVLHPYENRGASAGPEVCFAVIDNVEPEDRQHINSFIGRRYAEAVQPAALAGISLNNIHEAARVGKNVSIGPLSTLPRAVSPRANLEDLRKSHPHVFTENQKARVRELAGAGASGGGAPGGDKGGDKGGAGGSGKKD